MRLLSLALLPTLVSSQWLECPGINSVESGSCNDPTKPCEPSSGDFNAGIVSDIYACESLAEKPPAGAKGPFAAVMFNGPTTGAWAGVCILQNQAAWKLHKEGDHTMACLRSGSFSACSCGAGPTPTPPPGPSPGTPSWDACVVARTAYAKAHAALGGRGDAAVWSSLDAWMGLSNCANVTAPTTASITTAAAARPTTASAFRPRSSWTTDTVVLWIHPNIGSDTAAGTSETSPLRTLAKAKSVLRALPASRRAGAVVNLQAGTHELAGDSLVFTAEDSGMPNTPVTWQAFPAGAAAVISGGKSFTCTWTPTTLANGVAAQKCFLPTGVPTSFDSLFVDGVRQVRARYPNGDPLIPKSGYSPGSSAKGAGSYANTAVDACRSASSPHSTGASVSIISASTGASVGKSGSWCDPDATAAYTVKVVDIDGVRGSVVQTTPFINSSRFNDSMNLPVWSTTSTNAIHVPSDWAKRKWAPATLANKAVIKMMHPAGWGSWAFEVSAFDGDDVMTFGRGGNQEARGGSGTGDLYIENVLAELDAPSEWFVDSNERTLYYKPSNASSSASSFSSSSIIEVPLMPRVVQYRGTAAAPARDISLVGVNISRSSPTYLMDYENPSGGDWSIHRGGAVFLDGAIRITIERVKFDQVGGNGVFLSNHVVNSSVLDCDFFRTGDTAVAAVGSTRGVNGSAATVPTMNTISNNHFDTVGVYTKQTSCYFKAQTYANTIADNICHDGPRAGVNFNDGFMGGDELARNVIWGMVRETGDHGTFNSWDRKEYFYPCPPSRNAPKGAMCFMPQTHNVHGNMFIGPAGWNMDHDDASSEYFDHDNVVYQGGFKYRDGLNRTMTGNLMLGGAKPVFQVFGFSTDYFNNNYVVGQTEVCGPPTLGGLSGNIFIPNPKSTTTLEETELGSSNATKKYEPMSMVPSKCDKSPPHVMTVAQIEALAHKLVGIA